MQIKSEIKQQSIELLHEFPETNRDDRHFRLIDITIKSIVIIHGTSYCRLIDVFDPSTVPIFIIGYRIENRLYTIITDGYLYREVSDRVHYHFTLSGRCETPSRPMIIELIREYVAK